MADHIFLDDYRWPEQVKWVDLPDLQWQCVRTTWDLEHVIEDLMDGEMPATISFDHDLEQFSEGREFTGFDALRWLVGYCKDNGKKLPTCYFHSFDPKRRKDMKEFYEISILREADNAIKQ